MNVKLRLDDELTLFKPQGPQGLERKLGIALIMQAVTDSDAGLARLGRFEIESPIGGGTMGRVYRAYDPELQRVVAVKVLNGASAEEDRSLMRSEARALARLAHPNVVSVYDIGESEGQTYVTMEFIEGLTLAQWASGSVRRSWREILVAYLGAARGLAAAHGAGVIHRDFKPDNVLVAHDGRVRVADFGFAARQGSDDQDANAGYVLGTPKYMAPEVRSGATCAAASDQYAFCSVLLEVLTEGGFSREDGALAGVFETLERGCSEDAKLRHSSMDVVADALDDALVVPVAGDYREVLLERLAATFAHADLPHSLSPTSLIPLSLEDAPEYAAEGAPCLPTTREAGDKLHEAFDRSGGSLLVLGGAGAGKSTALSQLGLRLLERARRDPRESLPLLINLASLGEHDGDIESWLSGEALARYGLPEVETRNRLRSEAWVLLLDGLDEVAPPARESAIRKLNELRRRYPVPTVIGSREEDYLRTTARIGCRGAVRIAPLDAEQRSELLESLGPRGKALSAELEAHPSRGESLNTPLLLTLAALGESEVQSHLEEASLRERLYRGYLGHLLGDAGSPTDAAQLEAGARWLARSMRDRGLSEFWVERLQTDWLEGAATRAAAKLLGLLALLVIALILTGSVALVTNRHPQVPILLSLGAIPVVVVLNRGLSIRPLDEMRWSWRRSVEWIPKATSAGAFLGGVYGLVDVLWFNLGVGIISGLIVCIPLGLESSREIIRVRPNRSIRRSALNALGIGTVTGLVSGVVAGGLFVWICMPYLPPESPMRQLENPYLAGMSMTAAAVFFTSAMAGGGMAVVMHASLRCVLALVSPMPIRLIPFLERLVAQGVLRRVGGGYVFPHRTLLGHLSGAQVAAQRPASR